MTFYTTAIIIFLAIPVITKSHKYTKLTHKQYTQHPNANTIPQPPYIIYFYLLLLHFLQEILNIGLNSGFHYS